MKRGIKIVNEMQNVITIGILFVFYYSLLSIINITSQKATTSSESLQVKENKIIPTPSGRIYGEHYPAAHYMNERYTASSTILTFLVAWAATDQNYFLRPADDHFACALEVKSNIGFKRKVLVQPCSIMAAALGKLRPLSFSKAITFTPVSQRLVSTSGINQENEKGWFSKLLVRRIEPTKESHSRLLSDKEVIYELQTHNMRPDSVEKYLQNYKASTQLIHSRDLHCELVGSWTVQVGDLDQALHLWKYTGGFASIDNAKLQLAQDPDWVKLLTERGGMLRSRHLQYVLAFSYWPPIVPRTGSNIYEVRSYRLKPGTMIEWGNNWARAINYRRNNDEPFAAFFSQIGRLYNVHHMWCYKDLQTRKETREAAWRLPGWDECVAYTVPLIREMHTRILLPTDFSPTQ